MTPSLNSYSSQIASDGSRSDLLAVLSPRVSALLVICLGTAIDRGSPMESSHLTIAHWRNRRIGKCVEEPSQTEMAGCDAVTYLLERRNGETLREWRFVQEGWLFVAGILRKPGDAPWVEALARDSLATWEWVPGTETTVAVHPTRDSVREVTEISESIVTSRSAASVWALIRNVEHNRLLHKNFIDAYRVPGTPDGVGEEQALVLKFPGYQMTFTSIIEEEIPMQRIVTRSFGVNDPYDQQIYSLASEPDGTRLTLSMRYSVGIDPDERSRKAERVREAIHDFLSRVAKVLASGWDEGGR